MPETLYLCPYLSHLQIYVKSVYTGLQYFIIFEFTTLQAQRQKTANKLQFKHNLDSMLYLLLTS